MHIATAVLPRLLLAAGLLAASYPSLAFSAARKKPHASSKSHKKSHAKTAHPASKAPRRAVQKLRTGGPVYTVTATVYQAVAAQTDSHPFVTADNSTIRRGYSSRQHWVAVSRDLLQPWGGRIHYGDKVQVRGVSSKLDGVYTVHDTMHKRHRRRVDILTSPREHLAISSKNVRLQLVKPVATQKHLTKQLRLASTHTTKKRAVASHAVRRHRSRPARPAYLAAAIL